MIPIIKHSLRFVLFILVQSFIFNQLEIGWGVQFMIYPLFIFLLPWDMNPIVLMLISFAMGASIDAFTNTFGLHASSAVLIAFLRPKLFNFFEERDGFEPGQELSYNNMGLLWIVSVHGLLLLIHHLWFFSMELFKFNEILYIMQKTILSVLVSFIIVILVQVVFIKKKVLK